MASDVFATLIDYACAARRCALTILAAMFVLTWTVPARAQIARSWNTGDGDWSVPINWLPNGLPGSSDGAFIGSSAAAENATVTLDLNDTIAGLQITDGMKLDTDGNSLTINGDATINGVNVVPVPGGPSDVVRSELIVQDGGGAWQLRADDIDVLNGGRLVVRGTVQVDETLTVSGSGAPVLSESLLSGDGVVNFIGAGGNVLENESVIGAVLFSEALVLNQLGSGRIDLDGNTEQGRVRGSLTINGTALADPYDASIVLIDDRALTMNLTDGWTLGPSGRIAYSTDGTSVARINGSQMTVRGEIDDIEDRLMINADTVFESTARMFTRDEIVLIGDALINGGLIQANSFGDSSGRIAFEGTAIVQDGMFVAEQGATIDFNGPTTISGGTFNTHSRLVSDGSSDFNGATTYSGNITINGIARQHGDATVTDVSVITADRFDMDGASGGTTWDINDRLEVHAAQIDTGNNTFNGTIDIGGVLASRLLVDVDNSSQPEWTMAGTMNLGGIVIGTAFVDRLSGSRVIVTGDVNVVNRAGIAADAVFTSGSTLNFNNGAVSPVLRMSGDTTFDAGAALVGPGELENAAGGTMSLEAGLATGLVGVTNRGRMELGESVGVVAVDHFVNAAGATLVVDVGRNTLGVDSDVLTTSSGTAVLAGFLQPNIADVGGTFQEPQVGDTFTILTAVGGVSGMFDGVLDAALGGMTYAWTLIHNPNNVQIQLTSVDGLLCDYNLDGFVNAADYTVWRNTLGSTNDLAADGNKNGMVEMGDYTLWKNNYGATLGVGSGVQAPEPATATLFLCCIVLVYSRRRCYARFVILR